MKTQEEEKLQNCEMRKLIFVRNCHFLPFLRVVGIADAIRVVVPAVGVVATLRVANPEAQCDELDREDGHGKGLKLGPLLLTTNPNRSENIAAVSDVLTRVSRKTFSINR